MPKPKRPKRKRRPDLVDRLCKAVEELTAERASRSYGPQWVMVHDVARRLGISDEQATALALERLVSPTWPIRRIAGGQPLSFASPLASKTRVRPTRYDEPAAAPLAASSCCRRSVRHRPRHHSIGRAICCGMVPSLLFIVESPWQAKHCNASTDLTVRIIWLPESANLHAT